MTAANQTVPAGQETVYVLRDAAGQGVVRFTGTHLAYVSTGAHRSLPRWLTLDLYRKADGTYILHRIGYSVMYHRLDGCEGGERITLPDLLEETSQGEPCPKCIPTPFKLIESTVREDPGTDECVSLERNYFKVIELPDVSDIVRELEFVPRASLTGQRVISRPGQELLLRAAEHDGKIRSINDAIRDI